MRIRKSIELARSHETKTRELQSFLKVSMSRLHKAIQLSGDDASDALLDFVNQYVDQVPDLLETLVRVLKLTGAYEQSKLLVGIVDGFFVNPPELAQQYGGLHGLIAKAYLAHRLVEEMNDRLVLLGRLRLLPVDMTFPNIVVHGLLGEALANKLDLAVHFAIDTLRECDELRHAHLERLKSPEVRDVWHALNARWPDLAAHRAVRVCLSTPGDHRPMH